MIECRPPRAAAAAGARDCKSPCGVQTLLVVVVVAAVIRLRGGGTHIQRHEQTKTEAERQIHKEQQQDESS